MDLQEVGWGHGLHCSGSGWGRLGALVNPVMNLRELKWGELLER